MSELKKLNVDGGVIKTPEEVLKSTYKPIPETDTDYRAVVNSNMVRENGENCPDGANEKMMDDEEKKLAPKADIAEVKFVSDHQNGDAKIDIIDIKQSFSGLTKEELMKYCNDPFWVRLRWVMFIGFWLLWVGMLAGAIVIIVGAPKCAPPAPKTWWQEGPLLEIESPEEFVSLSASLSDIESKIPLYSDLKIKGLIIPEDIELSDDAYSVLTQTEEAKAIKSLADKAKEKDIRLIVELTPNYVAKTNEWFVKSEQGEMPYKDYFIWADTNSFAQSEKLPPNNWVSTLNKPAWTYSTTRKEFYLHQFNSSQPDLNFRNPEVVKEFDKVIQFWAEQGVRGIRLSKVKHLLVDQSLTNETIGTIPGPIHTEYAFYNHAKTTYLAGLSDILVHWRAILLKYTEGEGVLTLKEDVESIESLKFNGTIVVDLPRSSRALTHRAAVVSAKSLQQSIQSTFDLLGENTWPSWQFSSEDGKLSSELEIIGMLLPGSPIISLEQVMKMNSSQGSNEYMELVALRALPSMLHGGYKSFLLANDTVFSFTRLKSGNPGCIVLFNPKSDTVSVNTTVIEGVPTELTVHMLSQNYNEVDVIQKGKVSSDAVLVSGKSVIVLTYVPKKEE